MLDQRLNNQLQIVTTNYRHIKLTNNQKEKKISNHINKLNKNSNKIYTTNILKIHLFSLFVSSIHILVVQTKTCKGFLFMHLIKLFWSVIFFSMIYYCFTPVPETLVVFQIILFKNLFR